MITARMMTLQQQRHQQEQQEEYMVATILSVVPTNTMEGEEGTVEVQITMMIRMVET